MFVRPPASSKIVWMMKYADDTVVASLLQNEEDVQGKVLDDSAEWCEAVCWMISASKTEELLIDFFFFFRKNPSTTQQSARAKKKEKEKRIQNCQHLEMSGHRHRWQIALEGKY